MMPNSLVPNLYDTPAVRVAKREARTVYFAVKRAKRIRNSTAAGR